MVLPWIAAGGTIAGGALQGFGAREQEKAVDAAMAQQRAAQQRYAGLRQRIGDAATTELRNQASQRDALLGSYLAGLANRNTEKRPVVDEGRLAQLRYRGGGDFGGRVEAEAQTRLSPLMALYAERDAQRQLGLQEMRAAGEFGVGAQRLGAETGDMQYRRALQRAEAEAARQREMADLEQLLAGAQRKGGGLKLAGGLLSLGSQSLGGI